MQLWADYNEFAMWCLAGIISSGFAMFLLSRWRSMLAWISLAARCFIRRALFLRELSMYQKLRAIHLSTALFSLVFLLAFTIGAVAFARDPFHAPG
ncbi:MAG TPA: hypothetical protein VKT81_01445 [Bryobacteraceae bacterium]|nr:hypothetical protein [Bryobacteraceae bacterium]